MQSPGKCSVLLLGTFHMSNPGLDMHNYESDDVFAPKRQQEIQEVVEQLKLYNPTKVMVEALTDKHEPLNKQYLSYVNGDFSLTANETHQLGFRTAAKLGHHDIYPIDWNEWIGGISLGDVYDYAKLHFPELYEELNSNNQDGAKHNSMKTPTIRKMLLSLNNPKAVKADHKAYMTMARVGNGSNNIGIDWLCNYWYRRNMIIYANICRLSSPEDRILVIYGAGHIHLLSQFIKESDLFSLESVEQYLG